MACEGAVWTGSTLFAIPLSILRKNCTYKEKIQAKKVWYKVFKVLENSPYSSEAPSRGTSNE